MERTTTLGHDLDTRWIADLRNGDGVAFERLVREIGPRVQAVARRMLGDPNEAEEVVAETFSTVFLKIGQFAGDSRLTTWIHRIAVNAALLRLRSKRSRREEVGSSIQVDAGDEFSALDLLAGTSESAENPVFDSELSHTLSTTISELPEKHRIVIELRDIERRTPEQTADALGITRNAVKIRLHRARRALKTMLERRFGGQIDDFVEPIRRPRVRTPWASARHRTPLRASA